MKKLIQVFFMFSLVLIIKSFLIDVYYIPSESMYPNLKKGDLVFVNKITRKFKENDIIVFIKQNTIFIKRIFAKEDVLVSIKDKNYYKNKKLIIHSPTESLKKSQIPNILKNYKINEFYEYDYKIWKRNKKNEFYENKTRKNSYFVLGDNRGFSIDSRTYGPVHHEEVLGKANMILFNIKSFNRFFISI